jgi:hypothetical protein
MKDIWQHTSGTMYIRWIKLGVHGGWAKSFDAKNRACPLEKFVNHYNVTETDHYHWSVAKFLKLNIKMYKFYCQLYLLPKPEDMGAMANFFKTRKSVCWEKRQIGREQSNVWYN